MLRWLLIRVNLFFFFNDTATTEIYTLSLHDALPISRPGGPGPRAGAARSNDRCRGWRTTRRRLTRQDRKSTRLNSSHLVISYAVFCLKKKLFLTYYHDIRNDPPMHALAVVTSISRSS